MRKLIVVDIETTGLEDRHQPLEIAAVTMNATPFYMVPHLSAAELSIAAPDALGINRYYERGVYKRQLCEHDTKLKYQELHSMLTGNTLGGSNPRFDAGKLSAVFEKLGMTTEPWHHRLADLAAYAAGALKVSPAELPGLDTVCELLGVKNKEPHSAMGDAVAASECFQKLADL